MSDLLYRRMLNRRKCLKRIIVLVIGFLVSFLFSMLLFGDLKAPVVMHLTELNLCPACYGVSLCPELYSNQIILENTHRWSNIFNAKNIFYGFTKSNRRVVLKKLAHDWEMKEFDSKFCKTWNLKRNCKPIQLLNATMEYDKIIDIVHYNLSSPDTKPRKGLIVCPYAYSIYDLIKPILNGKRNFKSDMINVWTMLNINPEPIILQVLPKSQGWPVPAYAGVCGRLEVVAHEGEPLSTLLHVAWYRRLKFALMILSAAMDFTYKHDRFRFYLMDWSLDNIVVNGKDEVSFIDLEDVVVLDKHISPKNDLPDWYKRYGRENMGPGFSFSIENMCRHHLSDHNIWAACYIIAGEDSPLLLPIPTYVNASRPYFERLLNDCLNGDNRFKTIRVIQRLMGDMLQDETIVGYGVR